MVSLSRVLIAEEFQKDNIHLRVFERMKTAVEYIECQEVQDLNWAVHAQITMQGHEG